MNKNLVLSALAVCLLRVVLAYLQGLSQVKRGLFLLGSICLVAMSGYAVYEGLNGGQTISWSVNWFYYEGRTVFKLAYRLDLWVSAIWLILALLFLVHDYLIVLSKKDLLRSDALGDAFRLFGVATCLFSGNLITFVYGWSVILYGNFLFLSNPDDPPSRSKDQEPIFNAQKVFVYSFAADLIFLFGALGFSGGFSTDGFMADSTSENSQIYLTVMIVGGYLRLFSLPLLHLIKNCKHSNYFGVFSVLNSGLLMAPVLLLKVGPAAHKIQALEIYSVACMLAAIVSLVRALNDDHIQRSLSWLTAAFINVVFALFLWVFDSQILLYAMVSTVAIFLLLIGSEYQPGNNNIVRFLFAIVGLSFMGPVFFASAQFQLHNFITLLQVAQERTTAWVVFGLLLTAVVLMGLFGVRVVVRYSITRIPDAIPLNVHSIAFAMPAFMLSLLLICGVSGGMIFSGWFGLAEQDIVGWSNWLVRQINQSSELFTGVSCSEEIQFAGRMASYTSFLLSGSIGFFALEKDESAHRRGVIFWGKLSRVSGVDDLIDLVLWKYLGNKILSPVSSVVVKAGDSLSVWSQSVLLAAIRIPSKFATEFVDRATEVAVNVGTENIFRGISNILRSVHREKFFYSLLVALLVSALLIFRIYFLEVHP